MTDALEELTVDTLSKEQVQRRLDDWDHRLDQLYVQIASWLSPEWTSAGDRRLIQMHEEPMREVGLAPRNVPVLDLLKEGVPAASFVPRGLWIIGANGRVDISKHGGGAPDFLVDVADNFEPPQWHIVAAEDRSHRRPLNRKTLRAIL